MLIGRQSIPTVRRRQTTADDDATASGDDVVAVSCRSRRVVELDDERVGNETNSWCVFSIYCRPPKNCLPEIKT